MKSRMQFQLGQHLSLTPQLQQAIRLLQLSTLDLNQEIQQAIEANPMLEIIDIAENTSAFPTWDRNYPAFTSKQISLDETQNIENWYTTTEDLHEHLLWQVRLSPFSDIDAAIAVTLIDAINEDGFLSCSLEEIREDFMNENHKTTIEFDEIEAVLHRIQHFDPVGVGARNLSECLLIQLHQLPSDTPFLNEAAHLLESHIDLLGQHHYKELSRITHLKEEELQQALKLIQSLHPRPGAIITNSRTEYIIPDVIAIKIKDRWIAELNPDAVPHLRINSHYSSLIQRANNSSENTFLKNNLQEARWFLKSLQSRHETLLKVANKIIEYQQAFFEYGEEAMKPLTLHDIADTLELHESTISRVTTHKYLHTPKGVFELKYFFSSHIDTQSGGEASSTAIRAFIKKLIAAEKPDHPLSDNKIAQLLNSQGINIARRTVAKYRESLGIPSSSERKGLS